MRIEREMRAAEQKIAELVTRRVQALKGKKLQKEIAAEAGYHNQNCITQIRKMDLKVTPKMAWPLAKALETDKHHLMRLVMVSRNGRKIAKRIAASFAA